MAHQHAREGVRRLGVDEHVWHHMSTKPIEDGGRGPKKLTGDGRSRTYIIAERQDE